MSDSCPIFPRPERLVGKLPPLPVESAIPSAQIQEAAALFRCLGDPTRLLLLTALARGERCVCDLASSSGASPSAVSHQLRLLRAARLVRARKQGKHVFYRLDDAHVQDLLRQALAHVGHG